MAKIKTSVIRIIQKFLTKLERNGIYVEEAYLFGSFARETENKWSDIDVAVISPAFSSDRFNERMRLMKISSEIDSRIEPVPYRPENFVDEDPLVWQIKKEGIRIKPLAVHAG